jgi:multidrug efflux pump subunit AcrA (membrane-fusion protein)
VIDKTSTTGALSASERGTIDTKFAPVQHVEREAAVWVVDHQRLERVPVMTGISDGMWTAIVSGDVHDGEEVVSLVTVPAHK